MEKTTAYPSSDHKRSLARAARAEGRSKADLIREGIDTVTARHPAADPTIPLFDSRKSDLADRADEYLDGFGEG